MCSMYVVVSVGYILYVVVVVGGGGGGVLFSHLFVLCVHVHKCCTLSSPPGTGVHNDLWTDVECDKRTAVCSQKPSNWRCCQF